MSRPLHPHATTRPHATGPPHATLRALGTAVPATGASQEALLGALVDLHGLGDATSATPEQERTRRRLRRRLAAMHRHSGVARRHLVACESTSDERPRVAFGLGADPPPSTAARMRLFREHAPALALRAARAALDAPGCPAREAIRHVIVASCTGFFAPALDVLLVDELGLPRDVGRTLVGFQGCQAGLSALRLADATCRAEPSSSTLVACVELCSLHFQPEPTNDNMLANTLFADGAAAFVVSGPEAGPVTAPALAVERCATLLHAGSHEQMTWEVGDQGFDLHLGHLIPRILELDVRGFLADRLDVAPGASARTASWAVHPGGSAIVEAIERAFELDGEAEASWAVLAENGNMSSPTIHFVLDRVLADAPDGRPVVALAFGPGLTVEAARLRVVRP